MVNYSFVSLPISFLALKVLKVCPLNSPKGSGQVKKNLKIREKLGFVTQHPPTPLTIFYKKNFGNISKHENKTKNKKKKHNFQKKLKFVLGLDPPTHFRVFLGFLDFFNLTKPVNWPRYTWGPSSVHAASTVFGSLGCPCIYYLKQKKIQNGKKTALQLSHLSETLKAEVWNVYNHEPAVNFLMNQQILFTQKYPTQHILRNNQECNKTIM